MNFSSVAKAIGGGVAGAVLGPVSAATLTIPSGIDVPWYGYVIVAAINGLLTYASVYWSPRNR